jgi:hypothetical protein
MQRAHTARVAVEWLCKRRREVSVDHLLEPALSRICFRFGIIISVTSGNLGGGVLSFAPSSNRAALLAGIYLSNAITATLIILYQWTIANIAGHAKRVVASTLIAGSFSVGNIRPQTFRAKNATGVRGCEDHCHGYAVGGGVRHDYPVWLLRLGE